MIIPPRTKQITLICAHLVGVVGWVGTIAGSIVIDLAPSALPPSVAAYVTWWVLTPCAAVVLLSGLELARCWRDGWPRWIRIKLWCTIGLLALATAMIFVRDTAPAMMLPARVVGLTVLLIVIIVSVVRPGDRDRSSATESPVPPTGVTGKHRRDRRTDGGNHSVLLVRKEIAD